MQIKSPKNALIMRSYFIIIYLLKLLYNSNFDYILFNILRDSIRCQSVEKNGDFFL